MSPFRNHGPAGPNEALFNRRLNNALKKCKREMEARRREALERAWAQMADACEESYDEVMK